MIWWVPAHSRPWHWVCSAAGAAAVHIQHSPWLGSTSNSQILQSRGTTEADLHWGSPAAAPAPQAGSQCAEETLRLISAVTPRQLLPGPAHFAVRLALELGARGTWAHHGAGHHCAVPPSGLCGFVSLAAVGRRLRLSEIRAELPPVSALQ